MNKNMLLVLCCVTVSCMASEPQKRPQLQIGSFSYDNWKRQEDRFSCNGIIQNGHIKRVGPDFMVMCDGHSGDQVAELVSKKLPFSFADFLPVSSTKKEAFEKAFCQVEQKALKHNDGTTVLAVYFGKKHLHVAWAGDTRLVGKLCSTRDHGLERQDEWDRVYEAKGVMFRLLIDGKSRGPWRINGLEPTRTIGDSREKGKVWCDVPLKFSTKHSFEVKSALEKRSNADHREDIRENFFYLTKYHGEFSGDFYNLKLLPLAGQIIADPEYMKVDLNKDNDLFILATDGLWDVVDNESAIGFVKSLLAQTESLDEIAKKLIQVAVERGSKDNITVSIVILN